MNPIDRYQSDIASGKTSRDLAQLQVLEKLNELQEEINGLPASSPAWWQRTLNSLSARDPRGHAIKGLYLWGGVGRGNLFEWKELIGVETVKRSPSVSVLDCLHTFISRP